MPGPRLRIAVIGQWNETVDQLGNAGHSLAFDVPWDRVSDYEVVVLAVGAADLPDVVSRLDGVLSNRHIVIHTAVEVGAEPLMELPSLGIAMTCFGTEFVVSTCDETSHTVASVLVADLGGNFWNISDEDRFDLARALLIASESNRLKRSALDAAPPGAATEIVVRQLGGW